MICPNCQASLPIRFALYTRGAVSSCPTCRASIQPTPSSLKRVGLLIYVPATVASGILIPVGIHYAKTFNDWAMPLEILLALLLGITLWGFLVGVRNCQFARV